MDKEFRVLPSNGNCQENSCQHDRAVVKILFKSMMCLNERVEMCYSRNDQYSQAHEGTRRDTRGLQELLDMMHKQTQSSEILSKRKLRYSVHHFCFCCMLKWKLQRCCTFRSPRFWKRQVSSVVPAKAEFCYLRFKQRRKSFTSLQGYRAAFLIP